MLTIDTDFLKQNIRDIPDFPEKGIIFRDITPLFQNPRSLRLVMDAMINRYFDHDLSTVVGIDARGFLLGSTIAYELNKGFVPVRKKGKLPWKTISEDYDLEYGKATAEMHEDAVKPGDKVVIFDDLIATGGTMLAAAKLVQRLGGQVIEAAAIVDLPDLGGSKLIADAGIPVHTLVQYEGH